MKTLLTASVLIAIHALLAASAPVNRQAADEYKSEFVLELHCMARAPIEDRTPAPPIEITEPRVHCCMASDVRTSRISRIRYRPSGDPYDEVNEDPSEHFPRDLAEHPYDEPVAEYQPHHPQDGLHSQLRHNVIEKVRP
ncbi:MAG: hypothetical protein KDB82_18850 [Planctomycetes bacterium]|nr:hypothetical protein [Planctomycetota bacterium]